MAKKIPAISIIIAMYNAERYIEPCLQSLLAQTFQDFEVIVVDDCSTDKSAALVKAFIERFDGRLTLIKTKRNSGTPGLPRNLALKSARGKYITFFDSDDLLTKTALEELYTVAEQTDAEVVHAEKYLEMIDGSNQITVRTFQMPPYVEQPTLETYDIGDRVERFTQRKFLWNIWSKLFRRDFLSKNKIVFPNMTSFEDLILTFCCMIRAKNYVRIPNAFYIYRTRPDSLSHGGRHPFEIATNLIEAIKVMDRFMGEMDFFRQNPKYRYMAIDYFVQSRVNIISHNLYTQTQPYEVDDYLRRRVFNINPNENIPLITYLFSNANVCRLQLEAQQKEIERLRQQLAQLKNA